MAIAESRNAIGSVSRLIADHLNRRTGVNVTIGRPEDAAGGVSGLNIFLYEIAVDASMRNIPLRPDEAAPLWLVSKYLLTAFDDGGESETAEAHDLLGAGMSALQEISILRLDSNAALNVRAALESNPEPIKITFDQTPPDLINKLTQASDDEFRLSIAFEARPILIIPPEPTRSNLLVGIDYSGAPATPQPDFVGLDILASLGPTLHELEPDSFAVGSRFTLKGDDLHVSNLSCWLDDVELDIVMQQPDRLTIEVPASLGSGLLCSAGEHSILVRQYLPETGRSRKSNLLVGRLRPTVSSAVAGPMAAEASGFLSGSITINGMLLGTVDDTILVAFYANGQVVRSVEIAKPTPAPMDPPDTQTSLTLALVSSHRVTAGAYLLIVSVNGQQALTSPSLTLAP